MVGVLQPLEIGFYMAVMGIKQGGYSAFTPVPGQPGSVLVRSRSRDAQIDAVLDHGQPKIKLFIHVEADIVEKTKNTRSLNQPGLLKDISAEVSDRGKNTIKNILAMTQKNGSDIFGFGEHVRAKLPITGIPTSKRKKTGGRNLRSWMWRSTLRPQYAASE